MCHYLDTMCRIKILYRGAHQWVSLVVLGKFQPSSFYGLVCRPIMELEKNIKLQPVPLSMPSWTLQVELFDIHSAFNGTEGGTGCNFIYIRIGIVSDNRVMSENSFIRYHPQFGENFYVSRRN